MSQQLPNQPSQEYSLPKQTSDRDYVESENPSPVIQLTPGSPREKRLVESFKKTIAQHLHDVEDKTTSQFMDDLALDLWRITRAPYK